MNKNNLLFSLFFIAFSTSFLGAEAPELRNVMPNSWKKITRLSGSEEAEFLQSNTAVLEKIVYASREPFESDGESFIIENVIKESTRIYEQQAGNTVFYRLITVNGKNVNFANIGNVSFLQSLVYEKNGGNILIAISAYNFYITGQFDTGRYFGSIDIIEMNNDIKGILLSQAGSRIGYDKVTFDYKIKGQVAGHVRGSYFLWDEISQVTMNSRFNSYNTMFFPNEITEIGIIGSDCLLDTNIPLRYGLQNAFDGDLATSYVENTEDDLMYVQVYLSPEIIQRFAVINGYAQNTSLYAANNRIRKIELGNVNFSQINERHNINITEKILSDNTLAYQFMDTNAQVLAVKEVYEGNVYKDTCLAEFNVYTTKYGWLFGDVNE
jgi:hypothetical protein